MIKLKVASSESSFALVCVVVIALLLWTKSTVLSVLVVGKTERLKLHRSHGGLFWAPRESGRGQAAGSSDSFVLDAGEPLSSKHVCSHRLFTARALCNHNGERSGRMLCTTSPGECVGTPSSSQVCPLCSLDFNIEGWEPPLRQAAVIRVQAVPMSVRNDIKPLLSDKRRQLFLFTICHQFALRLRHV